MGPVQSTLFDLGPGRFCKECGRGIAALPDDEKWCNQSCFDRWFERVSATTKRADFRWPTAYRAFQVWHIPSRKFLGIWVIDTFQEFQSVQDVFRRIKVGPDRIGAVTALTGNSGQMVVFTRKPEVPTLLLRPTVWRDAPLTSGATRSGWLAIAPTEPVTMPEIHPRLSTLNFGDAL